MNWVYTISIIKVPHQWYLHEMLPDMLGDLMDSFSDRIGHLVVLLWQRNGDSSVETESRKISHYFLFFLSPMLVLNSSLTLANTQFIFLIASSRVRKLMQQDIRCILASLKSSQKLCIRHCYPKMKRNVLYNHR